MSEEEYQGLQVGEGGKGESALPARLPGGAEGDKKMSPKEKVDEW